MNQMPFSRRGQGSNRRLQVRHPIVEDLEGRQLLAGIIGQHIGMSVAAIQGAHIGTSVAAIQGAHIGTSVAAIQGGHIGTR